MDDDTPSPRFHRMRSLFHYTKLREFCNRMGLVVLHGTRQGGGPSVEPESLSGILQSPRHHFVKRLRDWKEGKWDTKPPSLLSQPKQGRSSSFLLYHAQKNGEHSTKYDRKMALPPSIRMAAKRAMGGKRRRTTTRTWKLRISCKQI